MLRSLASFGAVLAVSLPLFAQHPNHPVGYRDITLPNMTGIGSANLPCRIVYPATNTGPNQPIMPRAGGWPGIVFLHGFTLLGNDYGEFASAMASRGFLVTLLNTARYDPAIQENDGVALYDAMVFAAGQGQSLHNQLDPQHIGLAGHSMGGGNVANVMARETGYAAGYAFAPAVPPVQNASRVNRPFGIVVGAGERATSWTTNSVPYYNGLTSFRGLKTLTVLNRFADHNNVSGLGNLGGNSGVVWQHSARAAGAFFMHWLAGVEGALDGIAGNAAHSEPTLFELRLAVADPQLWSDSSLRINRSTQLTVTSEPGPAGILASFSSGQLATPFGRLGLNPSELVMLTSGPSQLGRGFEATLRMPADARLVGMTMWMQPLALNNALELRLGDTEQFLIGN